MAWIQYMPFLSSVQIPSFRFDIKMYTMEGDSITQPDSEKVASLVYYSTAIR